MKAVFRYPGSKWTAAAWIVSHFPADYEKAVYLEPYFGSGAVFFTKKPSVVETINDLDDEVVNLFQMLRSQPEELAREIELTPYSRREYDLAFQPCEEPLERARRFLVRTNQAIGAKMGGKCGWRNHKQKKIGGTACKWRGVPEAIRMAAVRLQGSRNQLVQIEKMDALRLIRRYNSPEVLMYLDPPYLRSTRKGGRIYRYEMDIGGHQELLEEITGSRARIILSGYDSSLYKDALQGWNSYAKEVRTTSGEKAMEMIWTNYRDTDAQLTLFDRSEAAP